jgi:hypothetical protein
MTFGRSGEGGDEWEGHGGRSSTMRGTGTQTTLRELTLVYRKILEYMRPESEGSGDLDDSGLPYLHTRNSKLTSSSLSRSGRGGRHRLGTTTSSSRGGGGIGSDMTALLWDRFKLFDEDGKVRAYWSDFDNDDEKIVSGTWRWWCNF